MDEKPVLPFGQFPKWVIRRGLWARMTPNERAVFGVLVVNGDNGTGVCSFTWERLSKEAGVRFKAIGVATDGLEGLGCISKERFGNRVRYQVLRKESEFAWSYTDTPKKRRKASHPQDQTGKFIPLKTDAVIPSKAESKVPFEPDSALSLASIEEQSVFARGGKR